MQHVVSRAVRDIDTNTVREREKSIALWARPASGQHHFLLFSILAGNGVCILENTGKTKALTRRTFVCKVMFLLFNVLSRFVIGEGDGTPLQYSCLENPMDGGTW